MARGLGPDGKGIYSVVILVPSMIMSFASLNIGSAGIYQIGKRLFPVDQIVGNTVFMVFAFSFPSIAVFWLIFPLLRDNSLRLAPLSLLVLIVAIMPVVFFNAYMQNLLLAFKRVDRYNLIRFLNALVVLILFAILFFIGRLDAPAAVVIFVIGTLMTGILLFIEISRFAPLRPKWSKPVALHSLNYGFRSYLTGLVASLNKRIDVFIIAALVTAADVGFYAVAVNLADILWLATNALSTLFFPHASALDNTESNRQSAILCRNSLFLSLPLIFVWGIVGSIGLPILYSNEFLPAIPLFFWLLPGVWAFIAAKVLSGGISAQGRPELNIIPHIFAVAVDIILILELTPRIGVVAAPIASTIAYCLSTLIFLFIFVRISHISWYKVIIVQGEDFALYKIAYKRLLNDARSFLAAKSKA